MFGVSYLRSLKGISETVKCETVRGPNDPFAVRLNRNLKETQCDCCGDREPGRHVQDRTGHNRYHPVWLH